MNAKKKRIVLLNFNFRISEKKNMAITLFELQEHFMIGTS